MWILSNCSGNGDCSFKNNVRIYLGSKLRISKNIEAQQIYGKLCNLLENHPHVMSVQYGWGCAVRWGHTMIAVGRHHDCRGGYSVRWGDTMMPFGGYQDCRGEVSWLPSKIAVGRHQDIQYGGGISLSTVADVQYGGGKIWSNQLNHCKSGLNISASATIVEPFSI